MNTVNSIGRSGFSLSTQPGKALEMPAATLDLISNQKLSSVKINGRLRTLHAHLTCGPAKATIRLAIEKQLEEKVLLFQLANQPEKAGEACTQMDDAFAVLPDGLRIEWQRWKRETIDRIAAIYQDLRESEGVFMCLWHPNMYGGDVTHVSVVMVGKTASGPLVDMHHHESIPVPSKAKFNDGRLPGSLGLRLKTYDTRDEFQRLSGKHLELGALPVIQSLALGGLPSVNFLVARDFPAAIDYGRQMRKITQEHASSLVYAPFASSTGTVPKAFYPPPPTVNAKLIAGTEQINTCYSAVIDLAIAGKIDGWQSLSRADLPQQGEQMRAVGMLSNTAGRPAASPGIAAFKAYSTQAGVDPAPGENTGRPWFDLPGTLLERLRKGGISLEQYRAAIRFCKLLPDLVAPTSGQNGKL